MFDGSLPEPAALGDVDDAALVGAIEGWARASAAADARRLAAIAELVRRRCDDEDDRNLWACDPRDSVAAEVAAALNLGHGRAVGQLDLSMTLRDRLPKLNAVFLAGRVDERMVSTIAWRTLHVADGEALSLLDTALTERATAWGPLSEYKLIQAVDVWVDRYDPAAVRRTKSSVRGRSVTVGDRNDCDGTASIWGRLLGTDAALLDRRLTAMAHALCEDDPRTLAQRRADALGALAAGADHLACTCGSPDCKAGGDDGRAGSVFVHIVADRTVLDARPDPEMDGDDTPIEAGLPPRRQAGIIPGGGIVPAPLLAALIGAGAKVRHLQQPCNDPEPRYRPSTALDEFVRIRDLTCRFPGCNRPAEYCDLDHTIAWPDGPTHPSNLKAYCRKHHLLHTFWTTEGWSDQQHPDGTITFTTPSGRTYTTHPGSRLFFPQWNTTTAPLPPTPESQASSGDTARHLMMPKRKRTRAKDREYRIKAERALNDAHVAEVSAPPPF